MQASIIRIFISSLLILLVSFTLSAQEKLQLTVEEAVRIGIENSNQLHASQMNALYNDARWSEVNTDRLPSLKLNANYTRLSEIDPYTLNTPAGSFEISPNIVDNYNIQLSLTQPIFTGFRLESNSNIAEYNTLASQESYNYDKQTLINNIKSSYWNYFRTMKLKEAVDENVKQVEAHLNDAQNLFDQGLATKSDLLKVKVQLSEAQLRQIDAKNNVQLANKSLNNVLNLPLSTEIVIASELSSAVDSVRSLNELTERAYNNRSDLKAAEYKVNSSESAITLAQSGWWPQIYLNGNFYYLNPNQRYFPVEEEFKDSWDASVTFQFDLWNWNKSGHQTDEAEALNEQAKDQYQIIKDAIALEVNQNYLNLLRETERMSVSEFNVEQAEENYRVTSELFKQGLILNSELLDAEVALLVARVGYIQSLVDYEIAKANLEKSIGEIQ
jgi:outer membrane protein TolC